MNIDYRDGFTVRFCDIRYCGRTQTVHNIILDTSAAQSLIALEAVELLHIQTGDDDIIVPMLGISGRDYALRKQIDRHKFGRFRILNPFMDFGNLEAHPGIDGPLAQIFLFLDGSSSILIHRISARKITNNGMLPISKLFIAY